MKTIFRQPTFARPAVALLMLFATLLTLRAQTSVDDLSVKNFGAKGDGAADDTAAFQNAIASASAHTNNGIYVPMGKYVISSTLTLNALEMVGKFSGAWPADTMPMPMLLIRQYTAPGIIVSNGASIHGIAINYDAQTPVTTNAPAISLQGAGVTLSSLRIQNPYDGITTPVASTPNRARLSDIFIVQPTHIGVQLSKCSDFVQLQHVEVWCPTTFSTGPGFNLGSINGGTFNGLVAYQCTPGIQIYTDASSGGGTFIGNFMNCSFDACTTGIAITGDHQVKVMAGDWDCEFFGATINGNNAQVSIVGGKWHANSQNAILVTKARNVIVDACMFYRSPPGTNNWASQPLVWISNCTSATVNSCQFLTNSTGLQLDSGVQRAVITGNSFEGGGIVNHMTSTNQIISNNLLP